MTTLNDVQAAIIKKIKSSAQITSMLGKPDDVREIWWQGKELTMPNIRVRVDQWRRRDHKAECH